MTRLSESADPPTTAGTILTILGIGFLGGHVLTILVIQPPPSIVAMEVPSGALATGMLVIGVQTVRGKLVVGREARRLAGWTLGGGVLFFAVGGWLRGLEMLSDQAIPHLVTLTLSITTLGAFVGTVIGLYDANRQAQARALREREQELEAQNDRLNEFASIVSHDLRNPLNVAQGRLELALMEDDSEHLNVVNQSLNRMEELINDLLVLTRVGEAVVDREPVTLSLVVDRSWKMVDTDDGRLINEAAGQIEANNGQLMELLENLFRNAVEHRSPDKNDEEALRDTNKGVTIRVGVLEDGFFLEDDGPGIPPEKRSQVFESGYSTAPNGTGFGLHIVQRIAEIHGWSVQATVSDIGGARFEFTGVEWLDDPHSNEALTEDSETA